MIEHGLSLLSFAVHFLIVVLVLTIFTGILVVSPGSVLQKFFQVIGDPLFSFKSLYVIEALLFCVVLCIQLAEMPDAVFRITIVGIAGANFLLSLFIEVSMILQGCFSHILQYMSLFVTLRHPSQFGMKIFLINFVILGFPSSEQLATIDDEQLQG